MSEPTLEAVDRDEAVTEAIAALYGATRADFLRTAAVGSAAMLATLATPTAAMAEVSDLDILHFGLRFERLQATFYTQAEELGTIGRCRRPSSGGRRRWGRMSARRTDHQAGAGPEGATPAVLRLRRRQRDRCEVHAHRRCDGGPDGRTAHRRRAAGARPGLTAALFGLLTVEARHAAWARHIVGAVPAPDAFDEPRTLRAVQGASPGRDSSSASHARPGSGARGSPADGGGPSDAAGVRRQSSR